jgi:hypothetical protein
MSKGHLCSIGVSVIREAQKWSQQVHSTQLQYLSEKQHIIFCYAKR